MSLKSIVRKLAPRFLIKIYHYKLAFLGALLYGFPSRKMTVIGITGTKGKSTVVEMASRILEEAGFKTASMSSIRFKIGEKEELNMLKMTMPGRFKIQKFLRQAAKENCKYAVIEVTSEGIEQFRHKFINFKTAVFTNLFPEHIESHGGFENYRKAKLNLFKAVKNTHIINADDDNFKYFTDSPAKQKYFFGIKNQATATVLAEETKGSSFKVQNVVFNLNLLGEFNIYNALVAICIGLSEGVSLEVCKRALEKINKVPGRMEIVIEKPFKVIVDYAHIPDALSKVYETLSGNLICVLGSCGGGRDKWKRPALGEIASKYCKEIIITNEDPYDEDPSQILSQIKSGISNSQFPTSNFYEILDRREAIKKALQLAKPDDTIIITGKGSEPWMCVENGKKIPWSDKQIAKEEFDKPR